MSDEIYIHIGYPKTGTTFLQQQYFPAINKIYFIDQTELFSSGFLQILFDDYLATDIDKYSSILNRWKVSAGEKKLVISYEGLIGNLFKGLTNFDLISRRLLGTGFKFKVLLSIRNQPDIIDSLYVQYVHQGGAISFNNFIKLTPKAPIYISLSLFDYNSMYRSLNDKFGEGNVFVLPYEAISNYDEMNKYLSVFFGIEIQLRSQLFKKQNISLSGRNLKILRLLNRFMTSWASANGIFPSQVLNTKNVRRFLQKFNNGAKNKKSFPNNVYCQSFVEKYSQSNQDLQKTIGVNLQEKYNYL